MNTFLCKKNIIKEKYLSSMFNIYKFREKLLAKLKLKPGPELSEGVEKDDQLWSALKR